jgi:hypothetical protein
MPESREDQITAGREALRRHAWHEAFDMRNMMIANAYLGTRISRLNGAFRINTEGLSFRFSNRLRRNRAFAPCT